MARKIVESARCVILVADSLKYERSAPVRIGHVSEVDHFVTDAPPPERLARICADNQVKVSVATETPREAAAGAS